MISQGAGRLRKLGFLLCATAFMANASGADRAVSSFASYELRDISANVKVHERVMTKLTTELRLRLDAPLQAWNEAGAQPGHEGSLAIEVVITDMKFVSGAKRAFAGGLAGSSHCAATAKLVDVAGNQVLFTREFSEFADRSSGAWTMGATDNLMLNRLAENVATWVIGLHGTTAKQ
jgi:hypothetical protein